jgi:transposase-like protein
MGKPYSMDLRERAVAAVLRDGLSRHESAARFGVAPSTVITWVRRVQETGSVAPGKMGGQKPKAIAGYCRPSSAEETGRAADTARDSPCVGDRRSRSSPRACPSCAAAPRTSRPGSTAPPDAPTAHRSDRWEGPLPTACSRPMRLGPHPESKPPSHLGGRESHPARPRQKLLGQALSLAVQNAIF